MRTFPTLTFCHVADAAFVCSCGITLLTTQWIPPERPLRGSSWAFTNHPVAAPGPTVRSRNRTGVPSFTFGPRGNTHQTRQWLFCNGANFKFLLLLNTMPGKRYTTPPFAGRPAVFRRSWSAIAAKSAAVHRLGSGSIAAHILYCSFHRAILNIGQEIFQYCIEQSRFFQMRCVCATGKDGEASSLDGPP